jgi:RHS repeat-associated protein
MELSDANQGLVESYRYSPYGEPTITRNSQTQSSDPLGQHWAFQGRLQDEESGNIYFRARSLCPLTGRFLQRDPLSYGAGANLYGALSDDPINSIDPMGTFASRDHANMTRDALEALGIGQDCIGRMVAANTGQDNFASGVLGKEGENHFTDPPSLDENLAALEAKRRQVRDLNRSGENPCPYTSNGLRNLAQGVGAAKGPCEELLDAIGAYLHNIQDFYSHTNYVQFWPPGQAPTFNGEKGSLPLSKPKDHGGGHDGFHVVHYGSVLDKSDHDKNGYDSDQHPEHANAMGAAERATAEALQHILGGDSMLSKCCPPKPKSPGK